ncbi:293_t:CDS:2, partial [Acaulospora morrowiae]
MFDRYDDFSSFVNNESIILFGVAAAILFALLVYILGWCCGPKSENFVVFNFLLLIYDLGFDIAFLLVNGNDVPTLYTP